LSRSQPATNARNAAVAHLLDGHLMFCSQETIGIHSAEISQIITVDPGIRERDPPIGTDNTSIEQGKQLRCTVDVKCAAWAAGAATGSNGTWRRTKRWGLV
jgi:hypothetical protein